MALLQIAEPGQSAAPHQHKRAVGIDLGTTNSLVAAVRSGQADTLCDEQGRDLLPSVVHYQAGQDAAIRVGFDAKREAALDPHNTIVSVKRMMGKALADMDTRQQPYEFVAADNGMPQIQTRQGLVNPVQVSAEILKKLAERGAASLGGALDGVVITVPAYFSQ